LEYEKVVELTANRLGVGKTGQAKNGCREAKKMATRCGGHFEISALENIL
jgi:hypothetical protein